MRTRRREPASPPADRSASEPVPPGRAGPILSSRPTETPTTPSSGDRFGDRDLAVGARISQHSPVDLLVSRHHPVDGEPAFDVLPAGERVDLTGAANGLRELVGAVANETREPIDDDLRYGTAPKGDDPPCLDQAESLPSSTS